METNNEKQLELQKKEMELKKKEKELEIREKALTPKENALENREQALKPEEEKLKIENEKLLKLKKDLIRNGKKLRCKEKCLSVIHFLSVAILFIILAIVFNKWICYVLHAVQDYKETIVPNCVFLVVFSTLALLFWKVFTKVTDIKEKREELIRKMEYEEFQNQLHKSENDKRFAYEKEKYQYDMVKSIADAFNKEKPTSEEVKKMKEDIDTLKNQMEKDIVEVVKKLIFK